MAAINVRGVDVLVDECDLGLVRGFPWRIQRVRGSDLAYAVAKRGSAVISMHRLVLGATPGRFVDHINRDGLDNRRANLRLCTHAENMRNRRTPKSNTTGFKGVWRRENKVSRPFTARIFIDGKAKYLGTFVTAEEAHAAYVAAAREFFGPFHRAA